MLKPFILFDQDLAFVRFTLDEAEVFKMKCLPNFTKMFAFYLTKMYLNAVSQKLKITFRRGSNLLLETKSLLKNWDLLTEKGQH